MTTATETILKQNEKQRQAQIFEHMIDSFLKRYKPQDPYDASEFERDLHTLVRQIYQDAQAPILERFTQLAMSIPTPFNLPR